MHQLFTGSQNHPGIADWRQRAACLLQALLCMLIPVFSQSRAHKSQETAHFLDSRANLVHCIIRKRHFNAVGEQPDADFRTSRYIQPDRMVNTLAVFESPHGISSPMSQVRRERPRARRRPDQAATSLGSP